MAKTSGQTAGSLWPHEIPHDLKRHFPTAAAIAALLHPHAEVVVHDIVADTIAGIWNSFSQRRPGDASNLRNDEELAIDQELYGPYEKAQPDGSRVKSVSAALPDAQGKTIGLLCINLDMSKFDQAIDMLKAFVSPTPSMPAVLMRGDVREQVNLAIREESERINKHVDAMNRNDRVEVVRKLDRQGVFQTRNAAPIVARAFNLSRASVYKMLREARDQSSDTMDQSPLPTP